MFLAMLGDWAPNFLLRTTVGIIRNNDTGQEVISRPGLTNMASWWCQSCVCSQLSIETNSSARIIQCTTIQHSIIMPRPMELGHYALMAVVCLSVSSVPQEQMNIGSWKLAGRAHLEVEKSKVKVTRPINSVTENQPYIWNEKAYKLQTRHTDGVQLPASPACAVTFSYVLVLLELNHAPVSVLTLTNLHSTLDDRSWVCNMP